jgi:hypothetical protein
MGEVRKFLGDAEVVYGAQCLFGGSLDGKIRWGVRQSVQSPLGEISWYHHAWGINDEADAHVLAQRINDPTCNCPPELCGHK